MRLLTVGDSFTYGEELENLSNAWPNLLANRIGYSLTNLAIPSGGNTQIVRNVVENYHTADLIVIAWSHFARIEFSDENGTYDIWPGYQGKLFEESVSYRHQLVEYLTRHYNDDYLYHQYLINIVLLEQLLKNKKYVMLDAFGNNQYRKYNKKYFPLASYKNFLGWPDESMAEWTDGCAKGPGGHFLEQGHQQVADKIYEYISSWL